jgi:hypothetical protein
MTKLLDRVDTAATEGARKQAAQSHASMMRADGARSASSDKGELRSVHGGQGQKVIIRSKPDRK